MRGYVDQAVFWTNAALADVDTRMHGHLIHQGYSRTSEGPTVWYEHSARARSLFASQPGYISYRLIADDERTQVILHAAFSKRVRCLSQATLCVTLLCIWVAAYQGTACLANFTAASFSLPRATSLLWALLLYQVGYAYGFPATTRRYLASRAFSHQILHSAAQPYPAHIRTQLRKPLGLSIIQETLLVAMAAFTGALSAVPSFFFEALTVASLAFLLILLVTAVGRIRQAEAPLTSGRRGALGAVALIYFTVAIPTLGLHLVGQFGSELALRGIAQHILGRWTLTDTNTALRLIEGLVLILGAIAVYSLVATCYCVYQYALDRQRTLDEAARQGEFEEHRGRDLPRTDVIALITIAACLSFALWASVVFSARWLVGQGSGDLSGLTGLPPAAVKHIHAVGLDSPRLVMFAPCTATVLTLGSLTLRLWSTLRTSRTTGSLAGDRLPTPVFDDLLETLPARWRRCTTVLVERTEAVLAYSQVHTWPRRRGRVILSSGLVGGLPPESVRFVVAHELGHIACGHHAPLTLLRWLSSIMFLDPGWLTALVNSPRLEDAADEYAWRLLGGDRRAAEAATDCLGRLDTLWEAAGKDTGIWRASSTRTHEAAVGTVIGTLRSAFASLIGMRHVLYEHPGTEARVRRLRQLAASSYSITARTRSRTQ